MTRSMPICEQVLQEFRLAVRRLTSTPVLSVFTVAILAVTLAANASVAGIVKAIRFRFVPGATAEALVSASLTDPQSARTGQFDETAFKALEVAQTTLTGLAMYTSGVYRVQANGQIVDVGGEAATYRYLPSIGAALALGRYWTAEDDARAVSQPVAIISWRLFERLFGADPNAIGGPLTVEARQVTLIAVMERSFTGLQMDSGVDIFLPLGVARSLQGATYGPLRASILVGARAPGVTIHAVRAEMVGVWNSLQDAGVVAAATPPGGMALALEEIPGGFSSLRRQWSGPFTSLLLLCLALILVGCVNLIGLAATRSAARERTVAVQFALGAGVLHILRGHVADGIVLAACAVAVGLPFSWLATAQVSEALGAARTIPLQVSMAPDPTIIALVVIVALAMGSVVGVLSAWPLLRRRHSLVAHRTVSARMGLAPKIALSLQIVMSMSILVSAALLAQSLWSLRGNQLRVNEERVVFTRIARNPGDRATLPWTYARTLMDRLTAAPEIEAVALSAFFPSFSGFAGTVPLQHISAGTGGGSGQAFVEHVTPGFFRMFAFAQLSGRDFDWHDGAGAPQVAILNRSAAAALFFDRAAVGQHLRLGPADKQTTVQVVGVVSDGLIGKLREPDLPVVFRPMMQDVAHAQSPIVHAVVPGDIGAGKQAYSRIVEAEGRHFVRGLFTFAEWFDNALIQERLMAGVSAALAALSLALTIVGIYATFARSVTERAKELAVRVSIGASRRDIVWMIVREGLRVALPSAVIGLGAAAATARLVRSQLFGVEPTDPSTLLAGVVIFALVPIVATLMPAWRAGGADPLVALRET